MRLRYPLLLALLALVLAPLASAQTYVAGLSGANEVPPVTTGATGTVVAELAADGTTVVITGAFSGLESDYSASHIHEGAAGATGGVIFALTPTLDADNRGGTFEGANNTFTFSAAQVAALQSDGLYINVHSADNSGGEIRGQLVAPEMALLITGVVDGPLSGGVPKAVEFYALEDIADLSVYGFGSANNGGGSDGVEFQLSGSASAGDFLYAASETTGFTDFFGFAPTFDAGGAAGINGDDAIELFYAPGGAAGAVIDVFGDINTDGSGEAWEYADGWAYRVDVTGPDGSTFALGNFTYSGVDALDGETTNAAATTPWPIGTYSPMAPAAISLPITFEESIDYELQDFEGTATTLVEDPADATNTVAQTVRSAGAACFAGTTVANVTGFDEAIPFTADETTMSVRVWSPEAGVLVLFKVEEVGNPGLFVETYTYTTVAGGWETLVFDFADPKPNGATIQPGGNYNKATIFFDFQCDNVPATTLPAADRTYYWDNVMFGGEVGGGDPMEFAGYLLGQNEVPAVETPAAGAVTTTLTGTELEIFGRFGGLTGDYVASHLHLGARGENGDVLVALSPTLGADDRSGEFDETVTLTADQAAAVRAGNVYVNVHTETNAGGELRAQLEADPAVKVITLEQARYIGPGFPVAVEGTVSRAFGQFTSFQDATGGLTLRQTSGAFFDDVASGAITTGTTLRVEGELSEFASLLQINNDDLEFYSITGATDAPEPELVTFAELAANGEAYEGVLIRVRGLTFADAGGTFDARETYTASDDSGDGDVRIGNAENTEVDGLGIPPANSNVTGVGGQFSFDDPTVGYQILPILATDVEVATANEDELGRLGARLAVQNPAMGAVTVRFDVGTPGAATLTVYDAVGRQVAVLAEGDLPAGEQTATLDAGALASGVYVVRLSLESGALTRVVTVVR